MTTLLLADDHVVLRQGLAALLGSRPGWRVVAEADDGAMAVQLSAQHRPDVVVLDVSMPGMSGIDATPLILRASPETRVIALSMYGDTHYQQLMFKAGASAYVLKSEAIDRVIEAIEAALRGESYSSHLIIRHDGPTGARSADLDKRQLSDREIEVLRALAEGRRAREIAEQLGISAKTVETYRARIQLKLGIDNLAELVRFAIRAGITSADS